MIELGEKEATEAVAEKEAAETSAHAALLKQANLEVCCLPTLSAPVVSVSCKSLHRHEGCAAASASCVGIVMLLSNIQPPIIKLPTCISAALSSHCFLSCSHRTCCKRTNFLMALRLSTAAVSVSQPAGSFMSNKLMKPHSIWTLLLSLTLQLLLVKPQALLVRVDRGWQHL